MAGLSVLTLWIGLRTRWSDARQIAIMFVAASLLHALFGEDQLFDGSSNRCHSAGESVLSLKEDNGIGLMLARPDLQLDSDRPAR